MVNKHPQNNSNSLYHTPEEKSSKLGLFSAPKVVLPLKDVRLWHQGQKCD